MIGAFFTIYIVCWTYQGAVRSGSKHIFEWVTFCSVLFFTIQVSWNLVDAFYIFSDTRPIVEPVLVGFLVVAFIRTKLIMRKRFTFANLFGQMNIFKSSVEAESDAPEQSSKDSKPNESKPED